MLQPVATAYEWEKGGVPVLGYDFPVKLQKLRPSTIQITYIYKTQNKHHPCPAQEMLVVPVWCHGV